LQATRHGGHIRLDLEPILEEGDDALGHLSIADAGPQDLHKSRNDIGEVCAVHDPLSRPLGCLETHQYVGKHQQVTQLHQ